MGMFTVRSGKLYFSRRGETVCLFAQGQDGIRVRATMNAAFEPTDWALEGAEASTAVIAVEEEDKRERTLCLTIGTRLNAINKFAFANFLQI